MIQVISIKNITKTSYKGKVYNLELESKTTSVEREDQYFIDASSGIVTHNCFPKDISALRHVARELNVPTPVLDAAWNRNITIDRPEKDWEQMKGRAVSE
jgi:UDP-glucose 6-dehydrogenase